MSPSNENLLSPDKPLSDPKLDFLNHASFASNLADSISSMMPPEGLVLGLYGPWGSGKSTLIEFVISYLEKKSENDRPIIIRFNPWWFSGQESLFLHFFKQLSDEFKNSKDKSLEKAFDLLNDFGDLVGEIPLPIAKLAQAGLEAANKKKRNVVAMKSKIVDTLRKSNRRTLVVIDDIDRLNAEEIRQIFALVKSVADFPNVIYLMAFDEKVVAEALSSIYNSLGNKFLDKIVQANFNIPPASSDDLSKLFLNKINSIIGNPTIDLYDDQYFGPRGYLVELKNFFKTPRDVYRLLNTLAVTFAAVKGEVNPADFVAIEALRVFQPDLHSAIYNNKKAVLGQTQPDITSNIFIGFISGRPDFIKNLLEQLFPVLGHPHFGSTDYRKSRRELRVNNPEVFDIYFRLSIGVTDISRQSMLDLIELAKNPVSLGDFIITTYKNSPSTLRRKLDRLTDFFDHLSEDRAKTIITVLLDKGDELINLADENNTPSEFLESIGRILAQTIIDLSRSIDLDRRSETLINILQDSPSNIAAIYLIMLIDENDKEYARNKWITDYSIVIDAAILPSLKNIALNKIDSVVSSSTVFDNMRLRTILHYWWDLEPEKARIWVRNNIVQPPELLEFIRGFIMPIGLDTFSVDDTLYKYFERNDLRERVTQFLKLGITQIGGIEKIDIAQAFLEATDDKINETDNKQDT